MPAISISQNKRQITWQILDEIAVRLRDGIELENAAKCRKHLTQLNEKLDIIESDDLANSLGMKANDVSGSSGMTSSQYVLPGVP